MKKTYIYSFILLFVLIIIGLYLVNNKSVGFGYKDATYNINGANIKLVNGESVDPIVPGSASKMVTKYFGNEVFYDFDKDGRKDVAFILTQNSGGSGTFYFAVVSLNKKDGYVGGVATIIGDRISPQSTTVNDKGLIVVNYADRKPGESFAVLPSVGKSLFLKFDPSNLQLGEVVQDFEGESDASKMSLGMKTWNWVSTTYNDGKVVFPKKDSFSITFKNNQFSAKTDCNGVGGEYVLNGNKISFERMMSTLMYCEGSQEADFSKMLSEVQSYLFTQKGELVLEFKMDSGSMVFK